MKNLIYLLITIILFSCSETKKNDKTVYPKKIIISGKVLNFDPYIPEISIEPNRLGYYQDPLTTELDSSGSFTIYFDSYIPLDVFISYETNFLVLAHPGDSIYLEFDGSLIKRQELLKTIKFSGNAFKTNQEAANFQVLFYSDNFITNYKKRHDAFKNYDLINFEKYLDTLQQKSAELVSKIKKDKSQNEETKVWASTLVEQEFYDALSFYPHLHKVMNRLKTGEWEVPDTYYDPMLKRLPITESMFISAYAISGFINAFNASYVHQNLIRQTNYFKLSSKLRDSLTVYGIINLTPDTLLKQMVLTEYFSQELERSEVYQFERFRKVIDEQIKMSFLKEPLLNQYYQVKYSIENPIVAQGTILKKLENSSFKQILDSIKSINKGKVIYVDCWATWCSPCRSEMINSKELLTQMAGKDVAFVYLCKDSQEHVWKATLDKLQIGGQHYFLNREQSSALQKALEIQAIPFYFLIDKSGNIVEKGNHLTPLSVQNKIKDLLNKKL